MIGIGETTHTARRNMLDLSNYNNNGQALTMQQYINLRNNYEIKTIIIPSTATANRKTHIKNEHNIQLPD